MGGHTILVFPHQTSWQYSKYSDGRTGNPLTGGGVEWRCGRQNCDSRRISAYRIDDCCSANNNCDGRPCSLRHRPPIISGSLFITTSMDDHDEEKRADQNLFVRSGKSEAEVANNRRLRSTYNIVGLLLKLTTDRHEASRGLSATARHMF